MKLGGINMRDSRHFYEHGSDHIVNDNMLKIARLKSRSQQEFKLVLQSLDSVNKFSAYAALIVFSITSYFYHVVFLTANTGNSAHLLALATNTIIALIVYHLIKEFHPLRVSAIKYWQLCNKHKKQIKKLEQETINK